MQGRYSFFIGQKQISAMTGFMLILLLIAAFNFAQIFYDNYRAVNASGMHTYPDGMEITVCYFGPPVGFYPRFLVFTFLLIACVSNFTKDFRGRIISFLGIVSALSTYIWWWIASYKAFKNFSSFGIDFMNSSEIKQVAYLYGGNWWDLCLALSVFIVLVLQAKRLHLMVTNNNQEKNQSQ